MTERSGTKTGTKTVLLSIGMDYPGKEISKNHSWHRGERGSGLTKTASEWKETLAQSVWYALLEQGIREVMPPISITISGKFWDGNHAIDLQNCAELVSDAVEEGTGCNDKHFSITTRPPEYGAVIPSIMVEVTVTVRTKE